MADRYMMATDEVAGLRWHLAESARRLREEAGNGDGHRACVMRARADQADRLRSLLWESRAGAVVLADDYQDARAML